MVEEESQVKTIPIIDDQVSEEVINKHKLMKDLRAKKALIKDDGPNQCMPNWAKKRQTTSSEDGHDQIEPNEEDAK